MQKQEIISTLKDKKFITGVVASLSVVIVGAIVVNAFSPEHHFNTMEERRYGGNHTEQGSRNQQFNDVNVEDIVDDYTDDNVDLNYGADAAKKDTDLTVAEMLTYAIEDEYLAQAEYQYIIDTFGSQRPFSNIINAEANHIALLTPLLEKYSTIPTNTAKDVIVKPSSIDESLNAGVQAEIDNIKMYETFLSKDLPDDVKVVFTELLNASQNHLQAFSRKVSR